MKSYITEIVNKIRDRDIVLWVGAGFSVSSGLPTGSQLGTLLIKKYFPSQEDKFKTESLQAIVKRILNQDTNIEKNTQDLYEYLKSIFIFDSTKSPDIKLQQKIKDIPNIENIVTTNYDNLFELAYKDKIDVIYNNDTLMSANQHKTNLYKIHGDFNDYKTIVLSDEDYSKFLANENSNLLLKKIEEFIALHSILFIGYSFSDLNILASFEKILAIIGPSKKNHYFVAPNQQPSDINYLERKGIHYIDASASDVLEKISHSIKKTFISDLCNNRIETTKGLKVAKENGFIPKLQSTTSGKWHISSIKDISRASNNFTGTLSLKGTKKELSKFIDFIEGKSFGKFVIPENITTKIATEINGFTIEKKHSIRNLTIFSEPNTSEKGSLIFSPSQTNIDVKCNEYHSEYLSLLEIISPYYTIKIHVNPISNNNTVNITISYDLKEKSLIDCNEQLRQLQMLLINSEKVYLSINNKFSKLMIFDTKDLRSKDTNGFSSGITTKRSLYTALSEIQEHFNISFPLFNYIPTQVAQEILYIQRVIKGEAIQTNTNFIWFYTEDNIISKGEKIKLDKNYSINIHNAQYFTPDVFGFQFMIEECRLDKPTNFIVKDIIQQENGYKYILQKAKGKLKFLIKLKCNKV